MRLLPFCQGMQETDEILKDQMNPIINNFPIVNTVIDLWSGQKATKTSKSLATGLLD